MVPKQFLRSHNLPNLIILMSQLCTGIEPATSSSLLLTDYAKHVERYSAIKISLVRCATESGPKSSLRYSKEIP